jgi:hypothetical protein
MPVNPNNVMLYFNQARQAKIEELRLQMEAETGVALRTSAMFWILVSEELNRRFAKSQEELARAQRAEEA